MRQLVLVPGADATHHICPSSKPQLAALSVPPILLDLPVPGREGDSHLSTHSNLPMYFVLSKSQHTTTLSILPFLLFSSSLFLPFPLWPERKPPKKGKRVEVGPQLSCSETLQGELWFNPQRRSLHLCDGTAWIAVLQGEAAHPGPLHAHCVSVQTLTSFSLSAPAKTINDWTTWWSTRFSQPAPRPTT